METGEGAARTMPPLPHMYYTRTLCAELGAEHHEAWNE
jgi:hypothetical protein